MIGIYGIKNKVNGKIYIGKSLVICDRLNHHKKLLRKRRHFNVHLQNSFEKYGEGSFEFVVLQECDVAVLTDREQHWIDHHSSTGVYNKVIDVKNFKIDDFIREKLRKAQLGKKLSLETRKKMSLNNQGSKNGFYGKTHSEENKKKISEWVSKNYIGAGNPLFGKKHAHASKILMSLGRGKLKSDDVLKIKNMILEDKLSHKQIADEFKVSRTVITRIANGDRWTNITGGPVYPEGRRNVNNFSDSHRTRIGKSHLGMTYLKKQNNQKLKETA